MSKRKRSERIPVVPVNYDLPHEAQIEEAKFDWVTDYDGQLIRKNPTEHLVPVPSGEMEQRITLVHLNRYAKTEEVLAEMEKLNLRPTTSHETLAFAKAHPDVQRKFPLIGLGSVWVASRRRRSVLYLYRGSALRDLRLYWFDRGWGGYCRFLAVRKS